MTQYVVDDRNCVSLCGVVTHNHIRCVTGSGKESGFTYDHERLTRPSPRRRIADDSQACFVMPFLQGPSAGIICHMMELVRSFPEFLVCPIPCPSTSRIKNIPLSPPTPVLHASQRKNYWLLEYEVSMDIADKDGSTPLRLASSIGKAEIVRLLLEHDADANTVDKNGWIPLSLTWTSEVRCLLSDYGASPL